MCCRFFWSEDAADRLERELGETYHFAGGEKEQSGAFDIRPQDVAAILIKSPQGQDEHGLALRKMTWGFPSPKGNGLLINARAETADLKPTFSEALAYHRCLIPASGFYEWDKDKNRATFTSEDTSLLYLCGIYQLVENMERFVVLTTDANASMIPVHDRMPLFVGKDAVSN